MKRALAGAAALALLALGPGACGRADRTPEGAVQELFRQAKLGHLEEVRGLISSGQFDDFDSRYVHELFGPPEVVGIETGVLRRGEREATVSLTLVTDKGKLPGRVPLDLVLQDGSWKIDYSGWSWPTALKRANFL